jgi:hypothetical protein
VTTAVEQLLEHVSPATLREIAAIREAMDPELIARRQLTDEGVERWAEIRLAGAKPTVGFWRRYRATRADRKPWCPDQRLVEWLEAL